MASGEETGLVKRDGVGVGTAFSTESRKCKGPEAELSQSE